MSATTMIPLDSFPGAVLRVNGTGHVQELNELARRLSPAFFAGVRLPDLLDERGALQLDRCLKAEGRATVPVAEFEARMDDRRFRLAAASLANPRQGCLVQVTDITAYRALSERVAYNEQLYRSLFSQNPDAVCRLDLDGRLVETNHVTEHLTGCSQKQLQDYHWSSVVAPRDRRAAEESFRVARNGNACSYRCRVGDPRGKRSIVQVTYIPILVDGEVVGVFGVGRDQTERYRLEESRRLLQSCMSQVHDVIIITETEPLDEPGPRITYVNEAIQKMTGYRPEEVLGRSPRLFQGPDTDAAALGRIRRALEARLPVHEVLVNYRRDGQPFWNEIKIVPIPATATGERAYFAAVQRDITHVKRREAELNQSREELRRLSRAQEQVLEQERRRIARDLHDELGQTLTALRLNLSLTLSQGAPHQTTGNELLRRTVASVDEAVDKVRDIASNLRPAMLDDLGFEAAAEWFLAQCARRENIEVNWLPHTGGAGRVSGEAATALFRILQECMTNISRHSGASVVDIH
ncbi:MAG: PAS domain S-box protein, partial [Marinobacter sp.]